MFIAINITEHKVGCVLIQAIFGCDPRISDHFDVKHWEMDPTKCKVYELPTDLLPALVEKINST